LGRVAQFIDHGVPRAGDARHDANHKQSKQQNPLKAKDAIVLLHHSQEELFHDVAPGTKVRNPRWRRSVANPAPQAESARFGPLNFVFGTSLGFGAWNLGFFAIFTT
jgi:hypothetical protein